MKFKNIRGTTTKKIGHTDGIGNKNVIGFPNSSIESVRQWINAFKFLSGVYF